VRFSFQISNKLQLRTTTNIIWMQKLPTKFSTKNIPNFNNEGEKTHL